MSSRMNMVHVVHVGDWMLWRENGKEYSGNALLASDNGIYAVAPDGRVRFVAWHQIQSQPRYEEAEHTEPETDELRWKVEIATEPAEPSWPRFLFLRHCPKCGYPRNQGPREWPTVTYHSGGRWTTPSSSVDFRKDPHGDPEYIVRSCRECGYEWVEAPLDAPVPPLNREAETDRALAEVE